LLAILNISTTGRIQAASAPPLGVTEVGVRRHLGAIVQGCCLAETLEHPTKDVLCGHRKGPGLLVRQMSGDGETGFALDKGGDPTPILCADH
jgi:hypothetical protein